MIFSKGQAENRTACGEALIEAGKKYSNLFVLDADVAPSTKTSLFHNAFPQRFLQIGIAEANMAGIAAGMASVGDIIPVVSTFACFATRRMLDQIIISIAYTKQNVKIIGSYGGTSTGGSGATHQAFEDLALMRSIPGMMILVPCDGPETKQAVFAMLEHKGPTYIRVARNINPIIFNDDEPFNIGKAKILSDGNNIALISTGTCTQRAYEASIMLEKIGISVRHIHVPTIKPMDEEIIIQTAKEIGKIITIEDHNYIGGLGSAVAEIIAEHAPCHLIRLGIKDHFGESGHDELLFKKFGICSHSIFNAAKMAAKIDH